MSFWNCLLLQSVPHLSIFHFSIGVGLRLFWNRLLLQSVPHHWVLLSSPTELPLYSFSLSLSLTEAATLKSFPSHHFLELQKRANSANNFTIISIRLAPFSRILRILGVRMGATFDQRYFIQSVSNLISTLSLKYILSTNLKLQTQDSFSSRWLKPIISGLIFTN